MFLISLDRLISVLFPLWFVISTNPIPFLPVPLGGGGGGEGTGISQPLPVVESKDRPSNGKFR
ncbi:unnamed protein product [Meloidogyne enterolobii]|uniref:Uncharacterized protein n=1 Tax=Meloidogyne enterolobii TaxID=390850 RepID=A0ACB1ANP0_MELEN